MHASRTPSAPWWLEGGSEVCPFCLGAYWIEVEVRCVACDRPGCMHCVVAVRERGDVCCPACAPPAGVAEEG